MIKRVRENRGYQWARIIVSAIIMALIIGASIS